MAKIRDALDLFEQETLAMLAEKRDVRGAKSNTERRSILSHSYRGDARAFVNDLRREDMVLVLRSWNMAERGLGVGSRTVEQLRNIVGAFFDDAAPSERQVQKPASAKRSQKLDPLSEGLDAVLPGWLVRLDTPPGSRDPLGLQALSGKHADAVLPGLTVFTSRARYYAFLCWAVRTAQDGAPPSAQLDRALRLERLLVLGEALIHGDDVSACSYIGGRRGRAFIREAGDASYLGLPSRVLKNQTGNGALRLYRTSLLDVELAEEDDLDRGLGLKLTDAGERLAEHFGKAVDDDVVGWALGGSDQRKRRDSLLKNAGAICLSALMPRRERDIVFNALFGKRAADASQSAFRRRQTAYHLLHEDIIGAANVGDIVPEDDAMAEDGGVATALEETRGNWRVIKELVSLEPKDALRDLQVASAYQLLALALNHIFGAVVDAVTTHGRVSLKAFLDGVATSAGTMFEAPAAGAPGRKPVDAAATCLRSEAEWPERAVEGVTLLLAVLRSKKVFAWLKDTPKEDAFIGEVLERQGQLEQQSVRALLDGLLHDMARRHRDESSRKGKAEWFSLEQGEIAKVDPRTLVPLVHSLRFAQLELLLADLGVGEDEVSDVA